MSMENTTEAAPSRPASGPVNKARRRAHRRALPQLLVRADLDGRSNAAKAFDRLARAIEIDLGGRDQLSAIALTLIEAYVGAAIVLADLNTRLALGQPIDHAQHAQAVSAMVRVAAKLGLQRRSRDVTPSLAEYLASLRQSEAEANKPATEEGGASGMGAAHG